MNQVLPVSPCRFIFRVFKLLMVLVLLSSCASPQGEFASKDLDRWTQEILKSSFRDEKSVRVNILEQDPSNAECSVAQATGRVLSDERRQAIEAQNLSTVRPPKEGQYFGDFKLGEALAQDGRGMTWSDAPGQSNGGQCYNCHQLSAAELSYGTLGPSLYQYGKIRGVKDLQSDSAKGVIEYTWAKLWNSKSFNACSAMPRYGHHAILSETQLKHLMSLLLDPRSPVNQ
jgi:sulfur-oxidizing protein SoxX